MCGPAEQRELNGIGTHDTIYLPFWEHAEMPEPFAVVDALMKFHMDVLAKFASAERDWAFGWVAAAAAVCGLGFVARVWSIYIAIATVVLLYGMYEALDALQEALAK